MGRKKVLGRKTQVPSRDVSSAGDDHGLPRPYRHRVDCISQPHPSNTMRVPTAFRHVYAISDVHTNYEANMDWVSSMHGDASDVLLLGGDVAEDLTTLEDADEHRDTTRYGRDTAQIRPISECY